MCGVVGIWNESRQAGPDLFVALTAMQHRGKESGGIATYYEEMAQGRTFGRIDKHIAMGEMAQVFMNRKANTLKGRVGVGHVRYSNTGSSSLDNAQPAISDFRNDEFALIHNGQVINIKQILRVLWGDSLVNAMGKAYSDCSDTRIIADLISFSNERAFEEAFLEVLRLLEGAFSLVALYDGGLYAARDPHGVHPLQLAKRGNDYIMSSESCAFDHLEVGNTQDIQTAELVRDIAPGELVIIDKFGKLHSCQWTELKEFKFDIFELIYFLRPDSKVHGVRVGTARRKMGCYLAEEHPLNGVVVPVKSSGEQHAWGYFLRAKELGYDVMWEPDALLRPNTSGRVWVMPYEDQRQEYLHIKFNVVPEYIAGRDIILVDDSIVRGTTISRVVALCIRAGARSVHVRSGSPQYLWPDIYGNDTYKDYLKGTLIARRCNGDAQRIAEAIGADSVGYLSLENTKQAILDVVEPGSLFTMDSFHDAVFTGKYALGTGDYEIK